MAGSFYQRALVIAKQIVEMPWPADERYPKAVMEQIINLFKPGDKETFIFLDEKPFFNKDFSENHWKLRRVRNQMGEKLFERFELEVD